MTEKSHLSLLYEQRKNALKQKDLAIGIVNNAEIMLYDTIDKSILEYVAKVDPKPTAFEKPTRFESEIFSEIRNNVLGKEYIGVDEDITYRLNFLVNSGQLEKISTTAGFVYQPAGKEE